MNRSRVTVVATIVLLGLAISGCEEETPHTTTIIKAPDEDRGRPWHRTDAGVLVAVVDAEPKPDLDAAIADAQASVEEARERWMGTSADRRPRWAVKWAAPTTAPGATEYLWVRPLHWSVFRVEGRLLSVPQRELRNPREAGDLVAFPIDELADWVYLREGGGHDGGFTIDALAAHFQAP